MIIDQQLLFSDAQAVTAAAASTNTVDLSVARDIGIGQELYVFVAVDVAMTDAGSDSTLTVDWYLDSQTTFTPDASRTLMIVPAVSAAGTLLFARIHPNLSTDYQYAQLYYTPNNGNLSQGTFTAGVIAGIQRNISYADGFTIS